MSIGTIGGEHQNIQSMEGLDAVHIRVTSEGSVMDVQIVDFVVAECFANKSSECTEREAKFVEKFLCFHILFFYYFLLIFFLFLDVKI